MPLPTGSLSNHSAEAGYADWQDRQKATAWGKNTRQGEHEASVGELIAEAASDSRRWPGVLKVFQQHLGATGMALGEFDFAKRQGSIVHAIGYGTDQLRRYPALCSHNTWLQQPERFTEHQILTCRQIVKTKDLIQSHFYKEFLEPQGFLYWLGAVLKHEDNRIVYLEAVRSQIAGPFGAEQAAVIRNVMPDLQQALQRNTFLWRLAIIQEVIDLIPMAVLAVSQDQKLLFANRSAYNILQAKKGIFLDQQQVLRTAASHIDTQLKAMITDVTSEQRKEHPGGALIVRRGSDSQGRDLCPLWLVVSPLSRPLRPMVGQEQRIALIFISAPDYLSTMAQTTLHTHFDLTPTEQKLTLLILQGARLTKAAAELNISLNTTRTHMKKIYAKTKTGCQADLVRLFLTGPLGL